MHFTKYIVISIADTRKFYFVTFLRFFKPRDTFAVARMALYVFSNVVCKIVVSLLYTIVALLVATPPNVVESSDEAEHGGA